MPFGDSITESCPASGGYRTDSSVSLVQTTTTSIYTADADVLIVLA